MVISERKKSTVFGNAHPHGWGCAGKQPYMYGLILALSQRLCNRCINFLILNFRWEKANCDLFEVNL